MVKCSKRKHKFAKYDESAMNDTEYRASFALLNNLPAMTFSKDAKTGRYLACKQSFAEYAQKSGPEGVVGLTDFEIFDPVTAAHFVEDDQKTLSMDRPYVFFEDVPDAAGTVIRNLQTTKLKFTDETGRLCTLGICTDVTEMVEAKSFETRMKVHQEEEKNRGQQAKMITALSSDYRSVYYVDLDKDEAVCYRADKMLEEAPEIGSRFSYLKDFTAFAELHVAEKYREGARR